MATKLINKADSTVVSTAATLIVFVPPQILSVGDYTSLSDLAGRPGELGELVTLREAVFISSN